MKYYPDMIKQSPDRRASQRTGRRFLKLKLLDYTIMGMLAGMAAAPVWAQQVPATAASTSSVSSAQPTSAQQDSSVQADSIQPQGKLQAVGKWSFDVPGGGIMWAIEDPTLRPPQFNLTANNLVAFENGKISQKVKFYAYSNYSDFVQRGEILIYRSSDTDLVNPLARLDLPKGATAEVEWDGSLDTGNTPLNTGDELTYIVRLYGKGGNFDETLPQPMRLVTPQEAQSGKEILRDNAQRQYGLSLGLDEAQARRLRETATLGSSLRKQNIPIHGSLVRIYGRELAEGYSVKVNGQSFPVSQERNVTAEFLVPIGDHRFEVELARSGAEPVKHTFDVNVTGRYLFAVALADVTFSGNSSSRSLAPIVQDDHYDRSLIVDGRLAFYLKGKVQGKYLITAQADTEEQEVKNLFKDFWRAKPVDVFRRLDPNAYYPVYGDDSTTRRDVDSMGKLYVRVDWDKNQVLWGNYNTGLTTTDLSQYSRSLYGAAAQLKSQRNNKWGDPVTEVRAFVSQPETVPGRAQFLGTGGSLYYLKHTEVLPGSEKVVLEVRDRLTGRVQGSFPMLPGVDYQINNQQGRIMLTRPLSQVTRENVPGITRDTPLDGYDQMLLVDYEYVPSTSLDSKELTYGGRVKHWLGDHVGVGLTAVQENRGGQDYSVKGADITLQAERGTYLKVEHSQSKSTPGSVFYSDNGGLTFTELNNANLAGDVTGRATTVEARANLKELNVTARDAAVAAWWRRIDAGYANGQYNQLLPIEEKGIEARAELAAGLSVYGKVSQADRGTESLKQQQLTVDWRPNDATTVTGEIRRVTEKRDNQADATGLLGAVKVSHRFNPNLELYGVGQLTLDDDSGRYARNNAITLGGNYIFGNQSTVGAEFTHGDRGNAAQIKAEYRRTNDHTLYAKYLWSSNMGQYDSLFSTHPATGWTVGQRWRLSNQVNVYNESQTLKNTTDVWMNHTFGMDFYPSEGWNTGFSLQTGKLDKDAGQVRREAASVYGGYTNATTQWSSKLEFRRDSGLEQREQWVATNQFSHKFSDDWRMAARLNFSQTQDKINSAANAKFAEANVGFAWRPADTTKYALFGRYTYLYDLSTLEQTTSTGYYDQRSHVFSLEGIYHPRPRWEFAGKVATRFGQVRMGRQNGTWVDSGATFAAAQVRYGITTPWHVLAEYRWLSARNAGVRQGWLVGVERDITDNFRIGAGYNFTDFSNNLTNFDYNHRGWYLNITGRY